MIKDRKRSGEMPVQLRQTYRHPFGMLEGYVPMRSGELALYRQIREAVPIIDAAIIKLIRLTGGFSVKCRDKRSRGLGTVDIIISSPEGMPTQELIAAVSEKLKQTREICVDIQVKEPEKLIMNISVRVRALAGYDPETVRESVKAAIEDMFGGRMLGRDLLRAALGDAIYHVPGVENFELLSPDYDYTGDPKKLLVPGNITISEWR